MSEALSALPCSKISAASLIIGKIKRSRISDSLNFLLPVNPFSARNLRMTSSVVLDGIARRDSS